MYKDASSSSQSVFPKELVSMYHRQPVIQTIPLYLSYSNGAILQCSCLFPRRVCFHLQALEVSPVSASYRSWGLTHSHHLASRFPPWPPFCHLDASYLVPAPNMNYQNIFNYPGNLLVFMEHKLRKYNMLDLYKIVCSILSFPWLDCKHRYNHFSGQESKNINTVTVRTE